MKINTIHVQQFAGLRNTSVGFERGMNVILGKNEAGKSTIFNALQKALLLHKTLNKKELKGELGRWIPIGGDTAAVELEFSVADKHYTLCRSWGAATQASLTLPDGAVLNDEKKVFETIGSLLPASIGTFKSTLMTYQLGLHNTLSEMDDYTDTIAEIGDLLRKAFMNSDGVSIDGLRTRIETLSDEHLGHWDVLYNRPEPHSGGAGSRWKKQVGFVLAAYYRWEDAKNELDKILRYENDYDAINAKISAVEEKKNALEAFVTTNAQIVKDLGERKRILAEERAVKMELEAMESANIEWPASERELDRLKSSVPDLLRQIDELQKEFSSAQTAEGNKSKADEFVRLRNLKAELAEHEETLATIAVVTKDDLKKLRELDRASALSGDGSSAGALGMTLVGKKDVCLSIQKDLDNVVSEALSAGSERRIEASGTIRVSHDDFEIIVTSGSGEVLETLAASKEAKKEFHELLQKLNVTDLDEADAKNEAYESARNDCARSQAAYLKVLGTRQYEALEQEYNENSVVGTMRQSTEVFIELKEKQNERDRNTDRIQELESKIQTYIKQYESHKNLLRQVGQKCYEQDELVNQLAKLSPPPPEAVTNIDAYLSEYETKKRELDTLEKMLKELIVQQATLVGGAPETSAEDQEAVVISLKREFDALLETAKAVERVKEVFNTLALEVDGSTFGDLERQLIGHIAMLTSGRYAGVTMNSALPKSFVTSGSLKIPGEYLSTGTKDIMGMAVRLTMARYFLENSEGFLVMDDPFVNLDAERKQQAAQLLRTFAQDKQVIVFTCHEDHAALLEGTTIRLN